MEVVRQRGQRRLARVQLRLAADLATLQVEVRLRVLQPRPTALLPGDEVLIERYICRFSSHIKHIHFG